MIIVITWEWSIRIFGDVSFRPPVLCLFFRVQLVPWDDRCFLVEVSSSKYEYTGEQDLPTGVPPHLHFGPTTISPHLRQKPILILGNS
jgi:hypothetical protein